MQTITVIGVIASICTGTSMLPQFIKIIQSKKSEDISFLMLAVLSAGLALWIVYGIMKEDYIIIVSNGFSLLVALLIIVFSYRYRA